MNIQIGDIVEYQYRNGDKTFAGIVLHVSEDEYCHVEWFDMKKDYFPYHISSLIIIASA